MDGESIYGRYNKRYVKSDTKTASGKRKSLDKGDKLAEALRGKSVDELSHIARTHGLSTTHWKHLNPGRFRMQVGRALRILIKGGMTITVDGVSVSAL